MLGKDESLGRRPLAVVYAFTVVLQMGHKVRMAREARPFLRLLGEAVEIMAHRPPV